MVSPTPRPTGFGIVVVVFGLLLLAAGALLESMVKEPWYLFLTGGGLVVAGVLLAGGRRLGAWIFLAVFLLMVGYSVVEIGTNLEGWVANLGPPSLLGAWLLSGRVRPLLR